MTVGFKILNSMWSNIDTAPLFYGIIFIWADKLLILHIIYKRLPAIAVMIN